MKTPRPAPSLPRLQLDRVEIGYVMSCDDVEALSLNPSYVRRVLLAGELLRHVL
jgi:hypothetical protein